MFRFVFQKNHAGGIVAMNGRGEAGIRENG